MTIDEIDVCVRRVLRLKEQLGLFEDPYRRGSTPEPEAVIVERRAFSREVARKAIVMLRNERHFEAPSMDAASYRSAGTFFNAARKITTALPSPQRLISTMLGLIHAGSVNHCGPCRPTSASTLFSRP